jgi:Arc/MetJ-type ribon-helix-helix transcriptional regulator
MKKTTERPKIIRDSFSLPEQDRAQIDALIVRAEKRGIRVTRSEIVRTGISVLASLSDAQLAKAIQTIERIKTGRPRTKGE